MVASLISLKDSVQVTICNRINIALMLFTYKSNSPYSSFFKAEINLGKPNFLKYILNINLEGIL